ncbi:MAG: MlaD family protein [Planktothrix sp. GU0601_MAG3]|nr:MAG: MlaD family protein [Planktothrix sp. GU0601_MAG3]
MRSRAIREGSVGLLILLGFGLLGAVLLWLKNISLGSRSYTIIAEFPDASALQIGTVVRYRGVKVGRLVELKASLNSVDAILEITPSSFIIPRNVMIQSNQIGLLNEGYIDIIPREKISQTIENADPLSPDCPKVILCNNTRISGELGIDIMKLIGSLYQFAEIYGNPELFANLNSAAKSSSSAAQEAIKLSVKISEFLSVTQSEIEQLNASVGTGIGGLNQSVSQGVNALTSEMSNLSTVLQKDTKEVAQATISSANSVSRAANQVGALSNQFNGLLANNRSSLVSTLENINQTTKELSVLVGSLNPIMTQLEQANIIKNLEAASANAEAASANLRNLSKGVSDPENLILIQQTLNSSRNTLQTLEKISEDVNQLTGDEQLQNNLKNLINGLGRLFNSTQRLEQQKSISERLETSRSSS